MNAQRANRNQAREAAREKAREMRLAGTAREKRNRLFVQLGLAVASILVIGTLVAVVATAFQPAGPGPLNMQSDGIKIGQDKVAVTTPALAPDADPVASPANEQGVLDITIWVDYLCPYCGLFERTNQATIDELLASGAATLEIHPIAILYARSQGTEYSRRASNAVACMANYYPNSVLDFHNSLFVNQPEEGTAGLTDEQLITLAKAAGGGSEIDTCINDRQFWDWVDASTTRALAGNIAVNNKDAGFERVMGTPTVLINGKEIKIQDPTNPDEFRTAVLAAAGQQK